MIVPVVLVLGTIFQMIILPGTITLAGNAYSELITCSETGVEYNAANRTTTKCYITNGEVVPFLMIKFVR